ncbi:DNA cytosine methyltransferase [Metabacillus arenae]|uniref:DNA (cytosine-5-)-methyltransferase n=1 Tax=Metabacillus arenae TaxID=2771434 RepID=A0A926NJ58_9BACI|nr:DNA cytosine methyltransferase [Metabacillus arenae]MBD1379077.1 DNA cytosine methyltransferase [Metabacillus arenae]
MNVLSLFDGISCGQVALERTGIKVDNYFASEINEDSMKVAKHNYPNIKHIGDVTKLNEEFLKQLPKIDLLIGGSPCQGLSKAKSGRKNLDDPRSKLFYKYVEIRDWLLKYNNPNLKYLLENVKPDKETKEIMNEEMGVQPIEMNSVLVSAQRRIRLYWTNIEGIIQPDDKQLKIKDIIYDNTYKIKTMDDQKLLETVRFSKNYVKWDTSYKGHYSQANRAYFIDGTMCTVPKSRASSKLNIWLGNNSYRRIHPIEAERLQTLPYNYTKIVETNNDDVRVGLVGDGWTVDVIAHIFSFMKEQIIHSESNKDIHKAS